MSRPARPASGFTLIEVMMALAILFGALVVVVRSTAMNITATQKAALMGIATDLARGKMYDIEEQLLHDGFQQLDKEIDGDFSDEDWSRFSWKAEIMKIEMPAMQALQGLDGEEGAGAGADSPIAGLLGMAGGGGGGGGNAAGASFLSSQFEIIANILEESIRKVVLTVEWTVGQEEQSLVVTAYFTDPAAVNRVIMGGPTEPEDDDQNNNNNNSNNRNTNNKGLK